MRQQHNTVFLRSAAQQMARLRRVAVVALITGVMTFGDGSDWRSDTEKAMSCEPATGQTCSQRLYHNMLSAKENCKHFVLKKNCNNDDNQTACNANTIQHGVVPQSQVDGHSAVGIPTALNFSSGLPSSDATLDSTPGGGSLPMQPEAAAECGFTIFQNMSVASYTRTDTQQPACCVGSGCTTDNYCHPEHSQGSLCTQFHCTVAKWTKCTVEAGGKLEYRYEAYVTESYGGYGKVGYHWFLQPSDMTCKSFRQCYCNTNLPADTNSQNSGCVANAAKAMCSSS